MATFMMGFNEILCVDESGGEKGIMFNEENVLNKETSDG